MFPVIKRLSEGAWLVEWDTGIDVEMNKQVHACASKLLKMFHSSILQVVPAYNSLLLQFDVMTQSFWSIEPSVIEEQVHVCIQQYFNNALTPPPVVKIPVCFDPLIQNDLEAISTYSGLSIPCIIDAFVSQVYHVYFLGFLPGFAYMGSVPAPLAIPRKVQPQLVKAGSVGIADQQTGIYPLDSPGAWNIVGRTPALIFEAHRKSPTILYPGQQVQFYPISLIEYNQLNEHECWQ